MERLWDIWNLENVTRVEANSPAGARIKFGRKVFWNDQGQELVIPIPTLADLEHAEDSSDKEVRISLY